jgi:hypothetical protein
LRTVFNMPLLQYVGVLAALGVFLAFLNPFGSVTEAPIGIAIAYWVPLIVYGGLAGAVIAWGIRRLLPNLPLWGYLGLLSPLMTAAVFPAVLAAQAWLMNAPVGPEDFVEFIFYILMISVAITSVVILGFRAFGKRSAVLDPAPAGGASPAPAAGGKTGAAAFAERLPIRLRQAEIYAVESEDHYLRVHTSAGQELILMRLADAVRELAGVEGMQTHRSWWVARQGLADVKKDEGKLVLKLKSGTEAPVSRTYAKTVKEAGWL